MYRMTLVNFESRSITESAPLHEFGPMVGLTALALARSVFGYSAWVDRQTDTLWHVRDANGCVVGTIEITD